MMNPPTDQQSMQKWVLALTSVAALMAMLDAMVVATAINAIRADLGASLDALQWTVNAYNLSIATVLLTGAALGDRFGRRRMFSFGVALFAVSSAACALAKSVAWLIAARIAQGAGAAFIMPLAMAILTAAYPPERRGKALGLFSGITGLALIVGPVLGGAIAGKLSWQWIFWINVPIALVIVPLAWRRIPESFGPAVAVDVPGMVLAALAALGIVWGLIRGSVAGWSSAEVVAALGGGAALAVAFVAREHAAAQPMMPMRMFGSRAFSASIAASFLFYAAMYGVVFFLPQFFQVAQGCDPLGAGLRLLPWTATLFVVAPVAGGLVDKIGERALMIVGLALQTLGFAWVAYNATPDVSYLHLAVALTLAGAGVSMAGPAAQKAAVGAVSLKEIGKASGIFNMFRILGGAAGIALAVVAFSVGGRYASPQAFASGFGAAMKVSAILTAAGVLAALGQPARRALSAASAKAKV